MRSKDWNDILLLMLCDKSTTWDFMGPALLKVIRSTDDVSETTASNTDNGIMLLISYNCITNISINELILTLRLFLDLEWKSNLCWWLVWWQCDETQELSRVSSLRYKYLQLSMKGLWKRDEKCEKHNSIL